MAAGCFERGQARTWPGAALREHVSRPRRAVRPDLLVLPEKVIRIGILADRGRGTNSLSCAGVAMFAKDFPFRSPRRRAPDIDLA